LFSIDPPGEPVSNPLGKPIRSEEWYFITENSLATCTVTVFPGEIVAVSKKDYEQLDDGKVSQSDHDGSEEVFLVQYSALVPLLEKNGFGRL
jgi:hypothetical protein